ncbi:MAG: class I adenylate-forming enzyme family protein [Alphaproteobacteria bacterium]
MTSPILSLQNAKAVAEFTRLGYWQGETIYDLAAGHAMRTPDRFAIRDQYRRLTWRQLVDAADGFAADLSARGVRPGQRVALWMPDRIESAVALLACSRGGHVCCPSPHRRHTVADVVVLLERMRAAVLIHQAGFGADTGAADIAAEAAHLGSLRHIHTLPPLGSDDAPFAGMLTGGDAGPCVSDPNDVVYLAFTSGSTGRPKGVMHSDNTLLVTARAISADWGIGEDSVVTSLSPFSHNLGLGTLLTAIVGGAEFVIHDAARTESLVDRLVEVGTTYLVGVPTHAIDLLAELGVRGMDRLGRVSAFRVSGAASPGHVLEGLIEKGITPQSGYGMTETNAHQYTLPDDDPALIVGTCGTACPGYEIRIFDEDDPDTALGPGEVGLVGGRGAALMLGYFDDQIATEASFNADGWFMTGDLGWVDEAGYLRLTGRKKEVIIRGGHNINPAWIEELAMRHAAVMRAAAVPVADERLGERVCLAVMFRPGVAPTPAELLDYLAGEGLSKADMPEFTLELSDIPLMSNGKIQKLDILRWIGDGRVAPVPIRADCQGGEQPDARRCDR